MRDWDENGALLADLAPGERAGLRRLVDAFIREQLPSDRAGCIAYAAGRFEERAADLPAAKQMVVLRFAAALRERLVELRCH